jgi:hypothetical protein
MKDKNYRPYFLRLLLVFAIVLVVVIAINEGTYMLQKDREERPPKTVELVIPAGTADRVAAGQSVSTIPESMVFMMGDTLVVKNEDTVDHQLGPVWVPPGSTASLALEKPNKYAYSCSFIPSKYLGLDVRQATTIGVRLTALAISAPTVTALIFIYSLLVFPIGLEGQKGRTIQNA